MYGASAQTRRSADRGWSGRYLETANREYVSSTWARVRHTRELIARTERLIDAINLCWCLHPELRSLCPSTAQAEEANAFEKVLGAR